MYNINKSQGFGLARNFLKSLLSYFTNRMQYVQVIDAWREETEIANRSLFGLCFFLCILMTGRKK